MATRAGIVVTGTEVLTGRVQDRNGPWLSDRLLELGIELAHITICGDRPADMRAQLAFMARQGVDLVITSGGLGPTADDLTIEVVAEFSERPLFLDEALEARIAEILRPLMKRFRDLDFDAVRASNRKQALVPEGAHVIYPAGTAPGLVVPGEPTIVVLPGPPRELHAMWPQAVESDAFQNAVGSRTHYEQQTLRLFGIPESEIAETLRVAEGSVAGFEQLEITTCLRRAEVEVVTRWEPAAEPAWRALLELISERHGHALFSIDGSRVDDQVIELLDGRSLAVAESCTAGLMAARLTERPGSSAYFAGGVVAYSNRGQERPPGRRPGSDRAPRRGVARGGRGDDRRGPRALRSTGGDLDHRGGGSGRGHRGQAGRIRVLVREALRRHDAGARRSPARRPGGDPRPINHGGPPPAAAAAARRGRSGLSGPRARMFVALDLPDAARGQLAGWRDELIAGRRDLRPVAAEALHVTLVFLGWQDEGAAAAISRAAFGAAEGVGAPVCARATCARCRHATRACSPWTWPTRPGEPQRSRWRCRTRSRPGAGIAPRSAPSGPISRWRG